MTIDDKDPNQPGVDVNPPGEAINPEPVNTGPEGTEENRTPGPRS